jgi:hypothetical protein
MNTRDILCLLKTVHPLQKCFTACVPIDSLPAVSHLPAAIVINTDISEGPGEHWVCIYISSTARCAFFDSLGKTPMYYSFYLQQYIRDIDNNYWYNTNRFQSLTSAVCGQYCIFFLFHLSLNYIDPSKLILRRFSKDHIVNDTIVSKFVQALFVTYPLLSLCTPSYKHNQTSHKLGFISSY